jgi:DNA-binding transcriptional LysR family regulator
MRKMEQTLDARLVERKKTGYELTSAGENVKQAALRVETEVLGVDGVVLGKDSNLVGPLRVTAINNMASTVLMPMFSSFSQAYPRVDLHIVVSNIDSSLAQREADVAIRLTNSPTDTLIGKRMVTVASTIYGNRDYLQQIREQKREPKWIGVECCEFHKSWTRHSRGEQGHNFYCDDTLLTLAALREGMGVSYLPCFMGDAEPSLTRYREPDPSHNLGLWILLHPDLKRTARVLAFRDHMVSAVNETKDLFEGNIQGRELSTP